MIFTIKIINFKCFNRYCCFLLRLHTVFFFDMKSISFFLWESDIVKCACDILIMSDYSRLILGSDIHKCIKKNTILHIILMRYLRNKVMLFSNDFFFQTKLSSESISMNRTVNYIIWFYLFMIPVYFVHV